MSVYQVKNKKLLPKSGNSWCFRCYYEDIYGRKHQKNSKMYKTKAIAKAEELKFLDNLKNHYNNYIDNDIDFIALYNIWWETKRKELKITNANNLKPSLDKNILSYFKNFKLKSINLRVLDDYLKYMEQRKISINYKNSMIHYCKECLLYASIYYNFDIKIANYLKKFRNDKPKEKPKDSEFNFWTLDEFKQFISFVDDKYYELIFTFLYKTGLRVGEFRALKWKDLDLINKTINISKELSRGVTIKPKTSNSIRIVDLDDNLIELLSEYKKEQKKLYGFNENWYLFGGLTPTSNTTLRRHLNKYIKLSKVKHITIHGFRHSHVSLLIYLGCDSRDVAERVGDTVQTIEHTYYHMFPKKKKETIFRLNNL